MTKINHTLKISKKYLPLSLFSSFIISPLFFAFYDGFSMPFFKSIILLFFLFLISLIDYYHYLIFDYILLPMLTFGLLFLLFSPENILSSLLAASSFSLLLLSLSLLSKGGMGGGDIKFSFVLGIWLGFPQTIVNIYITFILGGFVSFFYLLKKRNNIRIPFAPFLSLGAILAFFYGEKILKIYKELLM